MDFIDSTLSRTTGTITARLLFPNEARVLKPGEFVFIRIPMGDPAPALLIPETAVGSDQGQKNVFVVDAENKAAYRRVKLGAVYDGLQVVTEGLKPDEWVIVNGIQYVRDGVVVDPKQVDQAQPAK
jgi:RND family efflux transporter MFP subunit